MAESTAAELATSVGADVVGDPNVVVTGLTHDSVRVLPGSLFCCVVGERFDGHQFAASAVAAGAAALLVERQLPLTVRIVGELRGKPGRKGPHDRGQRLGALRLVQPAPRAARGCGATAHRRARGPRPRL